MDIFGIVSLVISFASLAGGLIMVWVKSSEKIALSHQQNSFLQKQVDELKIQVNGIEKSIADKVDAIHEDLTEIKINVSKLLNK